jgi:hypothetical protein
MHWIRRPVPVRPHGNALELPPSAVAKPFGITNENYAVALAERAARARMELRRSMLSCPDAVCGRHSDAPMASKWATWENILVRDRVPQASAHESICGALLLAFRRMGGFDADPGVTELGSRLL